MFFGGMGPLESREGQSGRGGKKIEGFCVRVYYPISTSSFGVGAGARGWDLCYREVMEGTEGIGQGQLSLRNEPCEIPKRYLSSLRFCCAKGNLSQDRDRITKTQTSENRAG